MCLQFSGLKSSSAEKLPAALRSNNLLGALTAIDAGKVDLPRHYVVVEKRLAVIRSFF
jgi:hypothetical protein